MAEFSGTRAVAQKLLPKLQMVNNRPKLEQLLLEVPAAAPAATTSGLRFRFQPGRDGKKTLVRESYERSS